MSQKLTKKEQEAADHKAKLKAAATKKSNKIQDPSNTVAKNKEEDKDKKKTIVDVVLSGPKYVWNKALVPLYHGVAGAGTEIKTAAQDRWEAEKAMYNQMGGVKYALDRCGKGGIKLLKLAGLVFGANLLNTFIMTKFGVSLFAPTSLVVIGVLALIFFIVKSVMTQRDAGIKETDGKAVGANVMGDILAAA